MKNGLRGFIRVMLVLVGLAILVYPSLSEYLAEKNSSRAVTHYDELILQQEQERLDAILEEARDYNRRLVSVAGFEKPMTDEQGEPITPDIYWQLLSLNGSNMMGYISIPCINVTVPIYHGTSEEVLQVGIGHLQNTSLPVGGESTHAALSGHRGLPSRALFTDLDQMQLGDVFYIKLLDQVLCYTVDQIETVLPGNTELLSVVQGEDHVTLITCTPYGVNSHRLLVRGVRTQYTPEEDGAMPVGAAEDISFWMSLPMQYRHLLLGVAAIIAFLLLRLVVGGMIRHIKKRRMW